MVRQPPGVAVPTKSAGRSGDDRGDSSRSLFGARSGSFDDRGDSSRSLFGARSGSFDDRGDSSRSLFDDRGDSSRSLFGAIGDFFGKGQLPIPIRSQIGQLQRISLVRTIGGRSGGQLPIPIRSQIGQLQRISLVRILHLSSAIRRPGKLLKS